MYINVPKIFENIAQYLKAYPKYSELLKIAEWSDYWVSRGEVLATNGTIDMFKSYGFNDGNWQITFFAVPNGAFNDLLSKSVYFKSIQDIEMLDTAVRRQLANNWINTLILGSSGVVDNSKAIPYSKLNQINITNNPSATANKAFMLGAGVGAIAFNLENMEAGQANDVTRAFIKRANIIDTSKIAGQSYVHSLDKHFADFINMGTTEKVVADRLWRADYTLGLLGWRGNTKAREGMNALSGKATFYGSKSWGNTLFLPTYEKVETVYDDFGFTDMTLWTWATKDQVPDDGYLFMATYWNKHIVADYLDNLTDGKYPSSNLPDSIIISNNGTTVTLNGVSANIVSKATFFDSEANANKVIYGIDASLYKKQ